MNKRLDPGHLQAAMTTADQAVSVPRRTVPGSIKSEVDALEPGDCMSKARMVEPGMTLDGFAAEAPAMREQLRNTLAGTVAKAKALTGGTYTIEVGNTVIGNRIYLVAVVTRLT